MCVQVIGGSARAEVLGEGNLGWLVHWWQMFLSPYPEKDFHERLALSLVVFESVKEQQSKVSE